MGEVEDGRKSSQVGRAGLCVYCKLLGYARLCACYQRLAWKKLQELRTFAWALGARAMQPHLTVCASWQPVGSALPRRNTCYFVVCTCLPVLAHQSPGGTRICEAAGSPVAGVPRIGGIGRECGDELPAASGLHHHTQIRSIGGSTPHLAGLPRYSVDPARSAQDHDTNVDRQIP